MHGVAKGIDKGLEAVDIENELLKDQLVGCIYAIMCPREAFPHCHAGAAQNRDLRWARAVSQRYSERPAVREISTVSRLHDGCKKRTVNTQQDLSQWRAMYHGHGDHPWDHSDTLKLTQTWERTPVQEVQRGLLWRNRNSLEGSTELLQGLWS